MSGNSSNGQLVRVPNAGEVQQAGFGSSAIEVRAETASSALAAQAKAAVEARYIMAMRNPRDIMKSRARILDDCKRPAFAKKAIYHKPVGKGVEGPSIRLAEAAARSLTNIDCKTAAIYDDQRMRIVRVMVTDLETNITFDKDVTVTKQVERNSLREGQTAIATRIGSTGKTVYVVAATDDEILDRENALISKALRTCLLRVIPGDLIDEALEVCRVTRQAEDGKDMSTARKKMCDAFNEIGVTIDQLAQYLGHPVDSATPPELDHMRSVYSAIEDGETTWAAALEARGATSEPKADPKSPPPAQPQAEAAAQPNVAQPQAQKAAQPAAAKPASINDLTAKSKAQRQQATAAPPSESKAPADQLPAALGGAREPGEDDGDEKL